MALPEQPVERGLPTPSIAVVICTWTADRLDLLRAAVGESLAQLGRCDELVVVIDHNEVLRAQLAREWHGTRARVVGSEGPRGLSGARNTGVGATKADVLVFLDDDALPSAGWLGTLREAFEDATVAAVGGGVVPRWSAERPTWFPDEFGWVVGCDYTGLAPDGAEIRNPIGANMAVRRDVLPLGIPSAPSWAATPPVRWAVRRPSSASGSVGTGRRAASSGSPPPGCTTTCLPNAPGCATSCAGVGTKASPSGS
ncbi:glycosyltransferase family 2 protein [Nocardioides alcanivorans]|uniref:glycosyltransferase family 2 protein n=1 Tax=Nocardioides alcanivorans TaxID=2897352 RepID=UPI001F22ED35|nr:glycosyltransferase family 2 protein [Nocardioides alcanivorans]